jgi:hypothetical protein
VPFEPQLRAHLADLREIERLQTLDQKFKNANHVGDKIHLSKASKPVSCVNRPGFFRCRAAQ